MTFQKSTLFERGPPRKGWDLFGDYRSQQTVGELLGAGCAIRKAKAEARALQAGLMAPKVEEAGNGLDAERGARKGDDENEKGKLLERCSIDYRV